jgi:hypothetical protein
MVLVVPLALIVGESRNRGDGDLQEDICHVVHRREWVKAT